MTTVATNHRLPPTVPLLLAGILASWLLLGGPGGRLAQWTDLDFHYLALPIALGGGLLLLNRLLIWAGRSTPARRLAVRFIPGKGDGSARQPHLTSALLAARRLPADLGLMILVLGLLSSVSLLPLTISERPGGPDWTSLASFTGAFESLAFWGVLLLIPFVIVRAIGEARPAVLDVVRFPRKGLITFAAAYVLLADGGVLAVAFEVQGSGVLFWLGLALGIFYVASVLRNLLNTVQPRRFLPGFRAALLIAEVMWLGALLGAVAALPGAVEPSLNAVHSRLNTPPPPTPTPPPPTPTPLPVLSSNDPNFRLVHGIGLPTRPGAVPPTPREPTPESMPPEPAPPPSAVELDPETTASYIRILHKLTNWAVLVLLVFGVVRVVVVFRPPVERVFGFPIARLILLAVVYVACSGEGVFATSLGINLTEAMAFLTLALIVSYGGTVLRNFSRLEIHERFRPPTAMAPAVLGSFAHSASWGLAALVVLNHLPVANAALLDHTLTRSLGEDYLPHFGSLFDIRYVVAGLCSVTALALSFPRARQAGAPGRYSPLLAALVFSAAGCMTWIAGSSLSILGHGFVLGGAVAAAGMYSLALSHLAAYPAASPNRMLADLAGWLAASKLRGFVLGMNVAFYGLLLRPVLYEFLSLAALLEYTALLLLMLMALIQVLNRMRVVDSTSGPAEPAWAGWSHHRQALESKPDRRAELTAGLRQRFVDHGEWKPLCTYLMGLLHRGEAPLDSIREVCRPLRNSASLSTAWDLPGIRQRNRVKRTAALEESLRSARQALAAPGAPLDDIHEDALRETALSYIENGTGHDALAVALISAHCQRGEDVGQAVERWFRLLDAPDPSSGWFRLPQLRPAARPDERGRRLDLVESAIAQLFVNTDPRGRVPAGSPA